MIDVVMTDHSGWYNLAHSWQVLLGVALILIFGVVLYVSSASAIEEPDEEDDEEEN